MECGIIIDGIPEGAISRKVGLIWGIPGQIPSKQLEYLHSRIRRAIGDPIPLRYRLASNPGDVSHDWLKDTYVNSADGHNVVYLPGLMTDNPGLDVGEYRKQLAHLDPVTRRQLEEGDWDVQLSGGVLDVTKLKYFTVGEFSQRVRYWDLAATEQKDGDDPDWTAGVLMGGGGWCLPSAGRAAVPRGPR